LSTFFCAVFPEKNMERVVHVNPQFPNQAQPKRLTLFGAQIPIESLNSRDFLLQRLKVRQLRGIRRRRVSLRKLGAVAFVIGLVLGQVDKVVT
jgi:hypothetical protein